MTRDAFGMSDADRAEALANREAADGVHKVLDDRDRAAAADRVGDNGKARFKPHIIGRTFDTIEPTTVGWIWPGRIPAGRLTLVAGDGGLGKSWLSLDLAARFSTGIGWPDARGQRFAPGFTLLMSAEDDPSDTIVHRLKDSGADLSRIKAIEAVRRMPNDDAAYLSLEDDIPAIRAEIESTGAGLLIVDPLSAYLPRVDSHRDAAIRTVLGPVAAMAADTGCAVLTIVHLNKSPGGSAAGRVSGSPAFVNAARMAFLVGTDPNDEHVRVLAAFKANIVQRPPSLRFQIVRDEVTGRGSFRWLDGACTVTADDMLTGRNDGASAVQRATEWLETELFPGRVEGEEIKTRARNVGHSAWALRQAAKDLCVEYKRVGFGEETRVLWSLPSHAVEVEDHDAK